MNPEDISVIALEPFINRFVFTIIQNIRSQNFSYEEKQVIHADLVPMVSEKVMHSSLKEKEIPYVKEIVVPISKSVVEIPPEIPVSKIPTKKKIPVLPPPPRPLQVLHRQKLVAPSKVLLPLKKQVTSTIISVPQHKQVIPLQVLHRQKPIPPQQIQPTSHQVTAFNVSKDVDLSEDYGRITPLLNDPVVSLIECQGVGKPLMIIRAGQRQITRITLNPVEIEGILQKASDVAHIPLLEGVFRAIVDNFSINAIISEMVGSKFVIRKQTPYSLLERQV